MNFGRFLDILKNSTLTELQISRKNDSPLFKNEEAQSAKHAFNQCNRFVTFF